MCSPSCRVDCSRHTRGLPPPSLHSMGGLNVSITLSCANLLSVVNYATNKISVFINKKCFWRWGKEEARACLSGQALGSIMTEAPSLMKLHFSTRTLNSNVSYLNPLWNSRRGTLCIYLKSCILDFIVKKSIFLWVRNNYTLISQYKYAATWLRKWTSN